MRTVTNSRSGELVISAPQREIDEFLVEAEKDGSCNVQRLAAGCTCGGTGLTTNGINKPKPLGIPTMNFRREEKTVEAKPVTNRVGVPARPTRGLGIPVMRF
jgi:hypothetical protein